MLKLQNSKPKRKRSTHTGGGSGIRGGNSGSSGGSTRCCSSCTVNKDLRQKVRLLTKYRAKWIRSYTEQQTKYKRKVKSLQEEVER